MLPLETSKAGLKRIDFDILNFLEYPKTLEQLKRQFHDVNVAKKLLDLQDKGLIHEDNLKYVTRFYTPSIKKIIDDAKIDEGVKKNFHFFLSQIDNPFVRENIHDSESRKKTEFVLSVMTRSLNKPLTKKESIRLRLSVQDLLTKLG